MRLIVIGCEYSGTTTIANAICGWAKDAMGARIEPHDHFKFPHIACYPQGAPAPPLTDEEQRQVLALSPKLKEMLQRQDLVYHYPVAAQEPDWVMVGYHIEDAVYGPIYFGYGLEDEPHGGPRTRYARTTEMYLKTRAPEPALVLVTASPDVIATRMRENSHTNGVLRAEDIGRVLRRFQEEYDSSLLRTKLTLDTSTTTVYQTIEEFKRKYQPFISDDDRQRILTSRALTHRS